MSRTISPEKFARTQQFERLVPIFFLLVLLIVGWMVFDHGRSKSPAGMAISLGSYLFLILSTGGIGLGYLAWWFSLQSKGILSTPRPPWVLASDIDTLTISTPKRLTRIPVRLIRRATLICDDNWDKMKGLEDKCLALDLQSGTRVLIPGSSSGFEDVLSFLERQMAVQTKYVE